MKEDELKPEHKIFAENYVIAWNGTQSYLKAYPNVSENTAAVNAGKLLRNTKIQEYIEHIQKDLAKLAGVSALRNVLELKKVAYTNLADFKDGWMTEKKFDELTEDVKAALSEINYVERSTEYGTETIVKFKVHDKIKAITEINKMLGFNSAEKVDVTTKGDKINTIPEINILGNTPKLNDSEKEVEE